MSRPVRHLRALALHALIAVTATSAIATTLAAQVNPSRRGDASLPRGYGDITFSVSQPLGPFNDYISEGYGLSGGFVWNFDRDRVFGIRAEGGFLQYDSEKKRACVSTTIGCRVRVDVNTDNDIVWGGIGPQITVPAGWVRPYMNATAGFSYFVTHSSVSGRDEYDDLFNTTNHDDAVFALTGGGGFLIPLSMRRTPVLLDLGATYHRNGEATYLRRGSIRDNPDGSIDVTPIRSEANFITYRIGVSIGVPTRR
jgi:hypothetical protein